MKKRTKVLAAILCLTLFAGMAMGSGSSGETKDVASSDGSETTADSSINDGAETGHSVYLKSLSNEADKQVSATGFKELLKIINSVTEVK